MDDQFKELRDYYRICFVTFLVWLVLDLNPQLHSFPVLFGALNLICFILVVPAFLDIGARKMLLERKYAWSNILSTTAAVIAELLNLIPGNPYAKGLPFFLGMQVLTLSKLEKSLAGEMVARRLISYLKGHKNSHPLRLAHATVLLGGALSRQGKYEESEKMTREAIGIFEKQRGVRPMTIASSLADLCVTLAREGRSKPAIEIGNRAVSLGESHSGDRTDQIVFGKILNNLAVAHDYAGQAQKAQELYERSLRIKLSIFGEKSKEAIIGYNNLGCALLEQKQFEKAAASLERARQTAVELDLKGSGIWPHIVTNCGDVHRALGQLDLAQEELNESLKLRQQKKNERDLQESLHCLAKLYRDKKEYDKAEQYFRKALELREKQFGREHYKVCQTLEEYTFLLKQCGRQSEADAFAVRIAAIKEELHKP